MRFSYLIEANKLDEDMKRIISDVLYNNDIHFFTSEALVERVTEQIFNELFNFIKIED